MPLILHYKEFCGTFEYMVISNDPDTPELRDIHQFPGFSLLNINYLHHQLPLFIPLDIPLTFCREGVRPPDDNPL